MKAGQLKIPIVFLAFLLILSACGNNINDKRNENQKELKVLVTQPIIENSESGSYFIGTVEAAQSVPISFSMPGTVEKVYASEGQTVGRGQKLAELLDASFRSTLQMAESQEKQAKDAFERLSKVYRDGSLPEIKYIEIESKLQQAVSSRQIALKNLNDCIVKAPVSGVVGRKNIEPGSNVLPSTPIMTIFKIDEVFIKISIPENEISGIKKGTKANIKIAALDNKEFSGVISEIGMVANQLSHTYDVKILVRNPKRELMPGMVCNVLLDNNKKQGVLSVPNNVLISENPDKFVYVINKDNKTVRKQLVRTGNYVGNNIIIREGLVPEDRIVVVGQQMLYDNAKVKIVQ